MSTIQSIRLISVILLRCDFILLILREMTKTVNIKIFKDSVKLLSVGKECRCPENKDFD